jgi:hypothetical protein
MTFAILAVAGVLLCAVVVLAEPPVHTLFWGAVFDGGHPPMFGAFALLVLVLLSRWRVIGIGLYLLAFVVALGLGIATELLQARWFTDTNPGDVLRDAIGITAFLLCHAAFARRRRRTGLLLLAGAIFFSAYVPVIATFRAYVKRDAALPVIFNFDAPWQKQFLKTNGCDVLPHGRLVFRPGEFPGIIIEEPYPNWNGWEEVTFRVSSSLPRPVSLVVRIDDIQHNNEYWDRFNRAFTIMPGDNPISIPVADIGAAPKTRKFDLAHVRRIFLFVPAPKESLTLQVSELRLKR